MFCGSDVGIYGGYLGVMAKLGPFCKRDNCSLVRGVLERLITHLSIWSLHVCVLMGLLLGGSLGAGLVVAVLVEGVGPMGVAGTLEVAEVEVELDEKLDGTFGCPLKVLELLSMWSKWWVHLLRLCWHPYHL